MQYAALNEKDRSTSEIVKRTKSNKLFIKGLLIILSSDSK